MTYGMPRQQGRRAPLAVRPFRAALQVGARGAVGLLVLSAPLLVAVPACKKKPDAAAAASSSASASHSTAHAAPPPSMASAVPTGATLAAVALTTWIHIEPKIGQTKLGYLRSGAIVARDDKPAGTTGCPGGWYGIKPAGYVCVGENATLDLENPVVKVTRHRRPDLEKPMPYRYGFIRTVSPQYLKVPNKEEQLQYEFKLLPHLEFYKKHEGEINALWPGANDVPEIERDKVLAKAQISHDAGGAKKKHKDKDKEDDDDGADEPADEDKNGPGLGKLSLIELFGADGPSDKVPWWLQGPDRKIPHLSSFVAPKHAVIAGRVKRHTGLAFVGAFETAEENMMRRFAITTDLRLVPIDKLKPNVGSQWHGFSLSDDFTLPVAFAYPPEAKKDPKKRRNIKAWKGVDAGKPVEDGSLFFRQAVALTGKDKTIDNVRYFEIKDAKNPGRWLKKDDIIIARKPDEWPSYAKGDQKWIDISIIKQTMILWEGDKPVYVSLVSTGQDGIGDPKTTKSTVRGTYKIREKHVTTTMDANEVGNKFELRDVPWVQYFEAGYALHAAYWHDVYGTPRSHGCINMAPIDARKVFMWTDPPLPQGWHAVQAHEETGPGTIVYTHI